MEIKGKICILVLIILVVVSVGYLFFTFFGNGETGYSDLLGSNKYGFQVINKTDEAIKNRNVAAGAPELHIYGEAYVVATIARGEPGPNAYSADLSLDKILNYTTLEYPGILLKEGDTISATFLEFKGKPEGDPALVVLNVSTFEEVDNMVTWIRDRNGDVALVFLPSSFQMQNLSSSLEAQIESEFGSKIVGIYRDKIIDGNILKDDQSVLAYWNKKFALPPFSVGDSTELYVRCIRAVPCLWDAYLATSPKPKTGSSTGTSAPSFDDDLRIPPDRPDLIEQYGNKS